MANANIITNTHQNSPVIGVPLVIPKESIPDLSIILRVIIAMDDNYDTETLIKEGEPYEALVRRLSGYHKNIHDIAERIKAVTDTK